MFGYVWVRRMNDLSRQAFPLTPSIHPSIHPSIKLTAHPEKMAFLVGIMMTARDVCSTAHADACK